MMRRVALRSSETAACVRGLKGMVLACVQGTHCSIVAGRVWGLRRVQGGVWIVRLALQQQT